MNAEVPNNNKRNLELLTALFCFVWGIWVLNPLVNTFSSAKIFDIMTSLAPEWVWGAVFFAIGLFDLIFFKKNSLVVRILLNTVIMFLFITLSILMGVSSIENTASPIYAVISLCSYLSATELFCDWKKRNIYNWKEKNFISYKL